MSVGDDERYVIIGRPESGYSMKVRSAIRYKGVRHEWLDRCRSTEKLHQAWIDPACGAHLNQHGPAVVAWIERMLDPKVEGDFESFESLEPTLRPLYAREVGPRFLVWDAANADSWKAGRARTELAMDGRRHCQKTFKYPAQTLSILEQRFAAAAGSPGLRTFPDETGCLVHLESMGA